MNALGCLLGYALIRFAWEVLGLPGEIASFGPRSLHKIKLLKPNTTSLQVGPETEQSILSISPYSLHLS